MSSQDIYTGPRVTDTASFIRKARWVHGDKYLYHDTEYHGAKTKCQIYCPSHSGYFWTSPPNHTSGRGCSICANRFPITKEEFIRRSNEAHDHLYDYSKIEYVNTQIPVEIVCPYHGEFVQAPSFHMAGTGCKRCSIKRVSDTRRLSLDQFEERSRKVHGDEYQYLSYISYLEPAEIVCKFHGVFIQSPSNHIAGKGCPKCANENRSSYNSLSDDVLEGFGRLYHVRFFRKDGTSFDKIGITCKTINERFSSLKSTGLLMETIFESTGTYKECIELEQGILERLNDHRFKVHDLRGTSVGGWTECFPSGLISI